MVRIGVSPISDCANSGLSTQLCLDEGLVSSMVTFTWTLRSTSNEVHSHWRSCYVQACSLYFMSARVSLKTRLVNGLNQRLLTYSLKMMNCFDCLYNFSWARLLVNYSVYASRRQLTDFACALQQHSKCSQVKNGVIGESCLDRMSVDGVSLWHIDSRTSCPQLFVHSTFCFYDFLTESGRIVRPLKTTPNFFERSCRP
jgi:hypothetical protein